MLRLQVHYVLLGPATVRAKLVAARVHNTHKLHDRTTPQAHTSQWQFVQVTPKVASNICEHTLRTKPTPCGITIWYAWAPGSQIEGLHGTRQRKMFTWAQPTHRVHCSVNADWCAMHHGANDKKAARNARAGWSVVESSVRSRLTSTPTTILCAQHAL